MIKYIHKNNDLSNLIDFLKSIKNVFSLFFEYEIFFTNNELLDIYKKDKDFLLKYQDLLNLDKNIEFYIFSLNQNTGDIFDYLKINNMIDDFLKLETVNTYFFKYETQVEKLDNILSFKDNAYVFKELIMDKFYTKTFKTEIKRIIIVNSALQYEMMNKYRNNEEILFIIYS